MFQVILWPQVMLPVGSDVRSCVQQSHIRHILSSDPQESHTLEMAGMVGWLQVGPTT